MAPINATIILALSRARNRSILMSMHRNAANQLEI